MRVLVITFHPPSSSHLQTNPATNQPRAMQSGISASPTLHTSFHTFLSTPSLFALLITITSERLEPLTTLPFPTPTSTLLTSLPTLHEHLHPNRPLYILLRSSSSSPSSPSETLIAITYIPDASPVRQKTLFASTRLTLLRELGQDKFSQHYFPTEAKDLSPEGWERYERHEGGEKPLTREEEVLGEVRRKEGEEGRGMQGRRAHVQQAEGMKVVWGEAVREAVRGLILGEGERGGGKVVMLKIDADESIALAGIEETDIQNLASKISATEPRYSFFRYTHEVDGREESPIVFIYTCPNGSKVKERMVYASFKTHVIRAASQVGEFEVAKKFEASSPEEITPEMLEEEFHPRQEQKQGFARPKRPGKR
ncbi:MAG: hypothetical protein Q9184_003297 [Pyrenodesmia sp. 2 TL-2023]